VLDGRFRRQPEKERQIVNVFFGSVADDQFLSSVNRSREIRLISASQRRQPLKF